LHRCLVQCMTPVIFDQWRWHDPSVHAARSSGTYPHTATWRSRGITADGWPWHLHSRVSQRQRKPVAVAGHGYVACPHARHSRSTSPRPRAGATSTAAESCAPTEVAPVQPPFPHRLTWPRPRATPRPSVPHRVRATGGGGGRHCPWRKRLGFNPNRILYSVASTRTRLGRF
jgi:hypothetical protein